MNATVRIRKELAECLEEKQAGVCARLVDDDLLHWKGTLAGPQGTPYEGGTFVVDIRIPPNYPFEPPKMRFDTRTWHPNISSQNGAICLDILKDQWSPALTMRTALLSLQALLSCPNADDPQDGQVAMQYKRDVKAYESTARFWTEMYAKPRSDKLEGKIANLAAMGFDKEKCKEALAKSNGDENAALDFLISNS